MGHNFDAANSISYSKGFEQAVMADSCYTSTYGATARHEVTPVKFDVKCQNWQMSVLGLSDSYMGLLGLSEPKSCC